MNHLFALSQKSKLVVMTALGILGTTASKAQQAQRPQDSIVQKEAIIDEVFITALRASDKTPVTFSNISKTEVQSRNLGQDIPTLLGYLPSTVMTTDAGNGVGYSGIRVRGSDATRVNITINGIPYNDSESHLTYWVNMPDLISSTENIQIQRGVGTSTNGAGAFGASINLLTDAMREVAGGEVSNSFGSYNTWKHTVKFTTGKLNEHFELAGRLSKIKSDGYIDRAWSDMKSYFLQGAYQDKNRFIKAITFGGKQSTYQAWNGLEDPDKLQNDRTYNTAGEMYDQNGNFIGFYKNETDNYWQDHYQLHWNETLSDTWKTNLALHYTKGKGYYENYKSGQKLLDYGLPIIELNGELIKKTDLIRQKWLDNDFYGTVFSVIYNSETWDLVFGGGWNNYEGKHFGKVLWTKDVPLDTYEKQYYNDRSTKQDFNGYTKINYQWNPKWNVFVDLQYRNVSYQTRGQETGVVDDTFNFFNPKLGVTYLLDNHNNLYFSYARTHKEPNRTDYKEGNPKPETLNDFELGWRLSTNSMKLNLNGYYMRYQDQLVLTGALSDTGAPIRENSGDSYRLGIEADAEIQLSDKWIIRPNIALSQNRNIDFYSERDGQLKSFGNTHIAFSPDIIGSNILTFIPIEGLQVSLLSKYVGKQYMSNLDLKQSELKGYFVNDLNITYTLKPQKWFEQVSISALINNLFNEKYISNGYFYSYDDDWSSPGNITTIDGAGYYPQATTNFMLGLSLFF